MGWSQDASKPDFAKAPLPGQEAHARCAVTALLADLLPGLAAHAQGAVMALLANCHRKSNLGAERRDGTFYL
jgi:hypothetical protein